MSDDKDPRWNEPPKDKFGRCMVCGLKDWHQAPCNPPHATNELPRTDNERPFCGYCGKPVENCSGHKEVPGPPKPPRFFSCCGASMGSGVYPSKHAESCISKSADSAPWEDPDTCAGCGGSLVQHRPGCEQAHKSYKEIVENLRSAILQRVLLLTESEPPDSRDAEAVTDLIWLEVWAALALARTSGEQKAAAELRKWKLALHWLTPGGSEFANDPEACKEYVKTRQESQMKLFRKYKRERDALVTQLQTAEACLQWIPVSERLPESGEEIYLCWTNYENCLTMYFDPANKIWLGDLRGTAERPEVVTHWIAVPQRP